MAADTEKPTSTAAKATQRAGFFDLPAELRNEIYDMVASRWNDWDPPQRRLKCRFLPGSQVSRQFRREFLARYYRQHYLLIETRAPPESWAVSDPETEFGFNYRDLTQWLDIFGDTRVHLLRDICFQGAKMLVRVRLSASISHDSDCGQAGSKCGQHGSVFKPSSNSLLVLKEQWENNNEDDCAPNGVVNGVNTSAMHRELQTWLLSVVSRDSSGALYVNEQILHELGSCIVEMEKRLEEGHYRAT